MPRGATAGPQMHYPWCLPCAHGPQVHGRGIAIRKVAATTGYARCQPRRSWGKMAVGAWKSPKIACVLKIPVRSRLDRGFHRALTNCDLTANEQGIVESIPDRRRKSVRLEPDLRVRERRGGTRGSCQCGCAVSAVMQSITFCALCSARIPAFPRRIACADGGRMAAERCATASQMRYP